MPKMKTRRAAAKRFRLTGGRRIRRHRAYTGHLMSNKSRKQKRQLRHSSLVSASDEERIVQLIGGKRK